jgi:hypothetical protein
VLDEGSGLVRRLHRAEVEATEVPVAGLGAAAAGADLVLLEATAMGPAGFVGVQGSRAAASVAYCAEQPVWLVGGVGRMLPALLFNALALLLVLFRTGELAGADGPRGSRQPPSSLPCLSPPRHPVGCGAIAKPLSHRPLTHGRPCAPTYA